MLRRCHTGLAAAAKAGAAAPDVTIQWPFGRPEARGTQRRYIPYPKKILEGLAARMADKKQDAPILVSICGHLTGLGKGWRVARNHWNLDGEMRTFATVTDIYNHKPPFEMSQIVGYMTVNGETSNCPIHIPQQHFTGWTALAPPEPEQLISDFTDRSGRVVEFSNKICISGIDYTTSLDDVKGVAEEYGTLAGCDWVYEAYDKATKQALMTYDDVESAKAAYSELHNLELDGMTLCVDPAARMVPRPPSIGVEVPVTHSFGKMPTTPSFNY